MPFRQLLSVLLLFCAPVLLISARAAQTVTAPAQVQHPLDPLSAAEIETAAKALAAAPQFPKLSNFATIVLKEPPKADVLSYRPGTPFARQAFAVILDRPRNRAFEAVVDVKAARVVSWTEVKGVQPAVLDAEHDVLVRIVKNDDRWKAAMHKRGIDDLDKIQIDNWAVGQVAPRYQKRRLLRALSYLKDASTNFYGRPIEGVAALLDVTYAGDDGKPYVLPKAVGIYERDGGMLWKHYESYSKTNESRRARELVVFFIATIGNYDYAISWIFHQDGVLELDGALTGIMLPKGVSDTKAGGHGAGVKSGHLVTANVVAPHHQHFFNFRLEFDVDGPNNTVHEMNTRARPR